MTKETTNQSASTASKKSPIKDSRIVRTQQDGTSPPCVIFKGSENLEKGKKYEFEMPNDSVYSGVVQDVTSAGGETLVEFENGLTFVPKD